MTTFSIDRVLLLTASMLTTASNLVADDHRRDVAPVTFSISDARCGLERCGRSPDRATGNVVARSGDRPQPSCCKMDSQACNPLHRAGHPESVSWLAIPSNSCRYGGYYVGGGLPVRGEQRCVWHEGTWGWDYFGILLPKRIALQWGHGRRDQGGSGAYKTDGPKLKHE